MEPGEQNHVVNHLPNLIKYTDCNVLLVADLRSKGILSENEVDILDSVKNKLEKSQKMYEILMTRLNSYKALKQALFKVHQSGAYNILNEYGGSESERTFKSYGHITYNSEELLGRGSLETKVYQGTFCNRNVAVKVLIRDLIDVDVALQEVKILEDIDWHENIVRYYHTEVTKKKVFIALELCSLDLDRWIIHGESKNIVVTPEEILRQITNGLAHLHKNRLVHRDLKPANIMICCRGDGVIRVKISDFGISKKIENGETTSFTLGSSVGGTEGWMAPEVILHLDELAMNSRRGIQVQKKAMSRAMDIFALGCIYFFVLSKGHHPFDPSIHRKSNIARDQPESLKPELINEISNTGSWILLIQDMIAHEPPKRPKVKDVLERLPNLQARTEVDASTSSFAESPEPAPHLHNQDSGSDQIHSPRSTDCAPEEMEKANTGSPRLEETPEPPQKPHTNSNDQPKMHVYANPKNPQQYLYNMRQHTVKELTLFLKYCQDHVNNFK